MKNGFIGLFVLATCEICKIQISNADIIVTRSFSPFPIGSSHHLK